MNRSGIKRGLAVAAISALAVTGVPALAGTASAETVTQDVSDTADGGPGPDATELFTQYAPDASTQNDGANTTIHLQAGGGTNVNRVRFEYGPAATPTTIATVSRTNGVFTTEWAPAAALLGTQQTVRAVPINSSGNVIVGLNNADSSTVNVNANSAAVNIDYAPGAVVGAFDQPYDTEEPENGTALEGVSHDTRPAIVTGTTSATDGVIQLSDRSENSRVFAGTALPAPGAPNANGVRPFRGTVNFSDYELQTGTNAVNEAIMGAAPGDITVPAAGNTPATVVLDESDDTEVVNLRNQLVRGVTAAATPAQVENGDTTSVTVTTRDQFGELLSGAQVIFDADNDGVWDAGVDNSNPADGDVTDPEDTPAERVGYTNASGQVVFNNIAVPEDDTTTFAFFVNTTDGDDFEPAVDFRRTVQVTAAEAEPQVADDLEVTSADGDAFDLDENEDGDLAATLTDEDGEPIEGQEVSYTYEITPFDDPDTDEDESDDVETTDIATSTTDEDGVADIAFDSDVSGTYVLNTYIDRDGDPGQTAGDLSGDEFTFTAGEADLEFDQSSPLSGTAGDSVTASATLELEDGTALAGREVNFDYDPADDSQFAPTDGQPDGTETNGTTGATATTDEDGSASVTIVDPEDDPQVAELGSELSASTGDVESDDADENPDVSLDGNPGASTDEPLVVNFGVENAPAGTDVEVEFDQADGATPGVAIPGTVTLGQDDDDDTPEADVAGVQVTLTVDQGFFTDGTPDPEPVVGAQAGNLDNQGTEITVVTDENGEATFQTAIERSEDFDDDGLATQTVTATSGDATSADSTVAGDPDEYEFDSSVPLNGGDVDLVLSPASEQDGSTTPAAPGDDIYFDVYTTDQFGNRVGGEPVDIETEDDDAQVGDENGTDDGDDNTLTVESDFDDDGDVSISSADAQEFDVTATWEEEPTVFTSTMGDGNPQVDNANPEVFTDTETVEFGVVTLTEATIVSSPEGTVRTGTVVTETITALDDRGNPVSGAEVEILRTGPAGQNDRATRTTDANGQALYSFTSTAAGDATITANITDGTDTVQATDTVTFTDGTTPPDDGGDQGPARIRATLKAPNNGPRNDVIRVLTTAIGDYPRGQAAGSFTKLIKVTGSGDNRRQRTVASGRLNANGNIRFVRNDNNGRNQTKYFAVINPQRGVNFGTRSNTRAVR